MRRLGVDLLGNGPKSREGEDIVEGADWIERELKEHCMGCGQAYRPSDVCTQEGRDNSR